MRKSMLFAAALMALEIVAVNGALAQGAPEEETPFDTNVRKALEAYKDRRYTAAIKYFRDAYALKTDPTLIFNIAKCYERLGKIEDAITHYQTYVDAPGTTSEDRADALARIKALKQEQAARDAAAREGEPPAPQLPPESKDKERNPPREDPPKSTDSPPTGPREATPGGALLLVVNRANNIPAVSKDQLRDIYFGRVTVWPNGSRVRPYARLRTAQASAVFFGPLTGIDAGQYAQQWQRKQLSGAGLAPGVLETPAAVIKAVAANEGAVGYLLPSEVPQKLDGVRLVELR